MRLEPINRSTAFRGGVNFMTPDVCGYYRGTLQGCAVHVELSRERPPYFSQVVGREPNGGPLWGVTIRRTDGSRLDPDPSFSAASFEEALDALRGF